MSGPDPDPDPNAISQEEEEAIIAAIDEIYEEPPYRGDECEEM